MAIELVVPAVGESITEVEIGAWLKAPGDFVEQDEAVVEIESDKATVEMYAPVAGTLTEILKQTGETAVVGDLIGTMEAGTAPESASQKSAEAEQQASAAAVATAAPAAVAAAEVETPRVMPAAKRALAEKGLKAEEVEASGPGGRLLKEDVQRHAETERTAPQSPPAPSNGDGYRVEEAIRMSRLRRTVAEHLVKAQQTAALLTTFNECDMSAVMDLRGQYKESYEKKYEVRLGFMSFFVKAAIEALKAFPSVNAEIRGEDIVYKNYYDIGIAVSGKKGLVVPVLRNAERLSFAEIELAIGDMARRSGQGKIGVDELQGGTFTITNGGVFGSLMSTPIINPPQSAILGMHTIQQRPVVRDGEVVARPMMYLAVTYDHRIIDGREAVRFLVRIKECIEDPSRILLEI